MEEDDEPGLSVYGQFRCSVSSTGNLGLGSFSSSMSLFLSKVMHIRLRDIHTFPMGKKLGMITDSTSKKKHQKILQEIPSS